MNPCSADFVSTEALALLSRRGWTITATEVGLIFKHQDGTRFIVRNLFVEAPGFDREQLLNRIALALVASVKRPAPPKGTNQDRPRKSPERAAGSD